MPRKHTDDELRIAADSVRYEMWMMHEAAAQLREPQLQVVANALIESFAIHARALINFLSLERKKPPKGETMARESDVIASDFCSWTKPTWDTGALVERVNKCIAHVTRERINYLPPNKDWDFEGILALVSSPFESFLTVAKQGPFAEAWYEAERTYTLSVDAPLPMRSFSSSAPVPVGPAVPFSYPIGATGPVPPLPKP